MTLRLLAALLALLIAAFPIPASAQQEARLSLVIGIQDYEGAAKLERPRADAMIVNNALKSIVFSRDGDVPLLDATRSEIRAAVDELANRAADARRRGAFVTVIVYFSGHGLGIPGVDNDIYLLPKGYTPIANAGLSTEELEVHAVRLAWIRQRLSPSADQIVFVIDACHTPAADLTGHLDPTPMRPKSGGAQPRVATLFAAQPGRTAPDDGAFSTALSESLQRRTSMAEIATAMQRRPGSRIYYTATDDISLKLRAAGDLGQPQPNASGGTASSSGERLGGISTAPRQLGTDIHNAAILPDLRAYVQKTGLGRMRTLAERGDATAQYMLGLSYSYGLRIKPGESLPQDWDKAADWLQRAQLGGEIRAANSLGYIYFEGKLGEKNEREAIRIWKAAEQRGLASAINNLGTVYRNGAPGIVKDIPKAIELFERAGRQRYAIAYINLGDLFNDPQEKALYDPAKAIAYYKLADALQDAAGSQRLAYMYWNGNGVPADDAETNKWLKRAAALGEPRAALDLAQRAESRSGFGDITPEASLEVAAGFERRAADLGDIDGMQRYASRLLDGKGIAPDRPAGIRLLREAVEFGSVPAKVSLARARLKDGDGEAEARGLLGQVVAANFKRPDPSLWPMEYYSAAILLRDLPDRDAAIAPELTTAEFRAIFGPPNAADKSPFTRFTVPIACYPEGATGKPTPFDVYVFDWRAAADMVTPQLEWVERERGCRAPKDVKEAFRKLYSIARENKVSFRELTQYAVGARSNAAAPPTTTAYRPGETATAGGVCTNSHPTGDAVQLDESLRNEKATILLQGKNMAGDPIFTYLQLTLGRLVDLRDMMRSQCDFEPSDFGKVLAAGKGEPSPELRARMAREYNMVDVPRPQASPVS